MIDPKQIPDEVVEAAAKALCNDAGLHWPDVPYAHNVMRGEARAAVAAALSAWPGLTFEKDAVVRHRFDLPRERLILPLPKDGE
jgi:hypothetical protein